MSESALDRERKAHQQTKDARQTDELRHKQELRLEQQFRTTAWNDLLRDFPNLKRLVAVLVQVRDAAHPLKGAPSEDTMRVGHPELTSVEAAADRPGPRRRVERANEALRRLADRLDDDMTADRKPPAPPKPRCRRRSCEGMDKVQPYGVRVCGFCGEPITGAA